MIDKFKKTLKKNGQSLKWFYDTHIKEEKEIKLTYGGFCHQLNGYAPLSNEVEKKIEQYAEG